jgi:hypothetical protein
MMPTAVSSGRVFDDIPDIGPAGRDAGHRRDVIGLKRMLHSEQKAKPQNSEHSHPDLTSTDNILGESGFARPTYFAPQSSIDRMSKIVFGKRNREHGPTIATSRDRAAPHILLLDTVARGRY